MTTPTLEYAVRITWDGEDAIVPVGDEVLARQTVCEFLERGIPAAPIVRTVTEWTIDQPALARATRDAHREQVLHIAQMRFEEEITPQAAVAQLAEFSNLDETQRAERLAELVSELEYQEKVDERRIQPGPGQDWESLDEAAEQQIRAAADALIGGADQ